MFTQIINYLTAHPNEATEDPVPKVEETSNAHAALEPVQVRKSTLPTTTRFPHATGRPLSPDRPCPSQTRSPLPHKKGQSLPSIVARSGRSANREKFRISDDERRLCGDFRVPADRVLAPDPMAYGNESSNQPERKRYKPGANHSFKPMDSLERSNPFQVHRRAPQTTYSFRDRHVKLSGQRMYEEKIRRSGSVDEEDIRHSSPSSHLQIHSLSSSKRRKMRHNSSVHDEVISLDDEGEVARTSPPSLTSPPTSYSPRATQSLSAKSQGSEDGESRHRPKSGILPPSGFQCTSAILDPRSHSKKSRHPTIAYPSRTQESQMASFGVIQSSARRYSQSSKTSLNHKDDQQEHSLDLLKSRNRPISSPEDQALSSEDELQVAGPPNVSPFFSKKKDTSSRINHSTTYGNSKAGDGQRPTKTRSANLQDTFTRTYVNEFDELAGVNVFRQVQRRDETVKEREASITHKSKKVVPMNRSEWSLKYVRTNRHQWHAPGLTIEHMPKSNTFEISVPDKGRLAVKDIMDAGKIQTVEADDQSRIRLSGSSNHEGEKYLYDLEFLKTEQFKDFCDNSLRSAISPKANFWPKELSYMEKIFTKPLPRREGFASAADVNKSDEVILSPKQTQNKSLYADQRKPNNLLINKMEINVPKASAKGTLKTSNEGTSSTNRNEATATIDRPRRVTTRSQAVYDVDHDDQVMEQQKAVFKYSVEHGLGPSWAKPLQYGSGRHRALIEFSDLERLDEDEMLNDALVDFYLIYLFEQMQIPPNKVYFFNSHFYTTLTRSVSGHKGDINYQGVSKWAKDDVFNYDYIVVPICEASHWYLAIICNAHNIARRPILDGFGESSPAPEALKDPTVRQPLATAIDIMSEAFQSRAPSKSISRAPGTPAREPDDDTNLFDEEQKSRDIKPMDKYIEEVPVVATAENNSGRESSLDETVRMQELTIDDGIPKSILGESVSFPAANKKRNKRKSAPPMRKYDVDEPIVIILDSMGLSHPKASKALKQYVLEEGRTKRGMDATIEQNTFYVREAHIPMQQNLTDCGVYLLAYAQKFFQDPRRFVTRILSREMESDTDWPELKASSIRDKMRDILLELGKQDKAQRRMARNTKNASKPAHDLAKTELAIEQVESVKSRLGSPFQPQSFKKLETPLANKPSLGISSSPEKLATTTRRISPRVVVSSQQKSQPSGGPKRTLEQTHGARHSEEANEISENHGKSLIGSPKRQRLEHDSSLTSPKNGLVNSHSKSSTMTASSPSNKVSSRTLRVSPRTCKKTSAAGHKKTQPPSSPMEIKGVVKAPVTTIAPRGSSAAPIEIDDSQDQICSAPASNGFSELNVLLSAKENQGRVSNTHQTHRSDDATSKSVILSQTNERQNQNSTNSNVTDELIVPLGTDDICGPLQGPHRSPRAELSMPSRQSKSISFDSGTTEVDTFVDMNCDENEKEWVVPNTPDAYKNTLEGEHDEPEGLEALHASVEAG